MGGSSTEDVGSGECIKLTFTNSASASYHGSKIVVLDLCSTKAISQLLVGNSDTKV